MATKVVDGKSKQTVARSSRAAITFKISNMIDIGSYVTYSFDNGSVVQSGTIISREDYNQIKENKKEYDSLSKKLQKEYDKQVKIAADQIVSDSPMGKALMGKKEGETTEMQLMDWMSPSPMNILKVE